MTRHAVVMTVSDSVSKGEREDLSGPAVGACLTELGWTARLETVADEQGQIAFRLREIADAESAALIVTTGGTGIAPRDVTPEATRQVIERELPGLGEAMRTEGRKFTKWSILSRGIAGTRGRVLIVNLPGSPTGAVQSLKAIADVIPHAIDLLHGNTRHEPDQKLQP